MVLKLLNDFARDDSGRRTASLDFGEIQPGKRPEAFGPFIRVTNSYNGLRALAFDIGFYRKVCRNGLIAPDTIVQFKFATAKPRNQHPFRGGT